MTKTFERFLRAFTDDELTAFAQQRSRVQPPYWRVMRLALRIEADRRGLALDEELVADAANVAPAASAGVGTA